MVSFYSRQGVVPSMILMAATCMFDQNGSVCCSSHCGRHAMIHCSKCGLDFAEHFSACPSCGCTLVSETNRAVLKETAERSHRPKRLRWQLALLAILLSLFLLFNLLPQDVRESIGIRIMPKPHSAIGLAILLLIVPVGVICFRAIV